MRCQYGEDRCNHEADEYCLGGSWCLKHLAFPQELERLGRESLYGQNLDDVERR